MLLIVPVLPLPFTVQMILAGNGVGLVDLRTKKCFDWLTFLVVVLSPIMIGPRYCQTKTWINVT